MDFRKVAVPLCAIALAACGGGGGSSDSGAAASPGPGGSTSGLVNAMTADTKDLAAFVGDAKELVVFATDLSGATIASPALTWTSSVPSVATAVAAASASTGSIAAVAPGSANIVVTSNGKTLSTPISVFAAPTTIEDLKKVFPYKQPGTGTVSTFSDVDAAGNDARFAHMTALWAYMTSGTGLLPVTGAPTSAEFYFTRDNNVLNRGRVLCGVAPFAAPPTVGSIMGCPDGLTERWFYVAPSNPLSQDKAQMQHELAEAFFERAVAAEKTFAWLYKGSTLYHEAGVLTGSTFAVDIASLKARLAADPVNNKVTATAASVLMAAPYDAAPGIDPIHAYGYSPAALLLFLQSQAPYAGTLRTVVTEIAAGSITTNAAAIARVLTLAGRTAPQLDAEYAAWRVANTL
jgi:hypothetical protein